MSNFTAEPVRLTRRETEIAELIARGEPKKLIAARLYISPRTVENTAKSIYKKAGVQNVGQLSTWFFCTKFNIKLAPLLAGLFMMLLCVNELNNNHSKMRRVKTRIAKVVKLRCTRPDELDEAC